MGIIPKSNIRIEGRGKIDTHRAQIYDRLLALRGMGNSINNGGAKLIVWAQTSPRSGKYNVLNSLNRISTLLLEMKNT